MVPYRVKMAKGQRGRCCIRIAAKPFEPRKILCRTPRLGKGVPRQRDGAIP